MEDHAALLRSRGISLPPQAFEKLLWQVVESLPEVGRSSSRGDLVADEVQALESVGADLTPRELGERDPIVRAALEWTKLISTSVTAEKAGKLLGVGPSRIRQLLAAKGLYGFHWRGRWLLPLFQFIESGVLPGLGEVLQHLPEELSPLEVQSFFLTADADLHEEKLDRALTPVEWLVAGRSAKTVARLIADL
jgi:hypothetical protein